MRVPLRWLFYLTFIIYCVTLLCLLLLIRPSFYYPEQSFEDYARHAVNLIPFKTLSELFIRNAQRSINADVVFDNAVGNLLLFFPMGIYLPCIYKKSRKFIHFLLLIFLIVLVMETFQLICRVGSFDVDDILLNVTGAAAGYGIWSIDSVQHMLHTVGWMK